jgi:hypothetical protein
LGDIVGVGEEVVSGFATAMRIGLVEISTIALGTVLPFSAQAKFPVRTNRVIAARERCLIHFEQENNIKTSESLPLLKKNLCCNPISQFSILYFVILSWEEFFLSGQMSCR